MKIKDIVSRELPEELSGELPEGLHIVLEVPEDLILESALLEEGKWVETGKKDLMCRVDPARPEMHQRRHVHIAQKKHVAAKNKQAAWNDDRTRHDKSSFDEKFGSRKAVQDVAREALGLDDSVVLEGATSSSKPLMEGVWPESANVVFFRVSAG